MYKKPSSISNLIFGKVVTLFCMVVLSGNGIRAPLLLQLNVTKEQLPHEIDGTMFPLLVYIHKKRSSMYNLIFGKVVMLFCSVILSGNPIRALLQLQ